MTGQAPHVWVARLDGRGASPMVLGGKAAAMDRMIALDMPVPPCGAITVDSYRDVVQGSHLGELVRQLISAPLPAPEDYAVERERVDEEFLSVHLPSELVEQMEALVAEIAPSSNLAVRSSATAEDLSEASFAGQYRSFLDVRRQDLADAVRLTWASLWHPAPRVYRRFRSIPETDLAMAVLIMPMLAPTQAGVFFTVDPGGSNDCLRIETVAGLGEQLVSGAVTPDVLLIPRPSGPAERLDVSPQMGELARLGLSLERAFGRPQDIEWAVAEGRLFLLQARPITVVGEGDRPADPFDDRARTDTTYTTSGIAEMLPGVLSPRVWEINRWAVEDAFDQLFTKLGGSVPGAEIGPLLVRFRGRAALNMNRMRAGVASIPGGSGDELEREYTGGPPPDPGRSGQVLRRAGVAQMLRTARVRLGAEEEAAVIVELAHQLGRREPQPADLATRPLLTYRTRIADLVARAMAAEVAIAAMAVAAHRGVESLLRRRVGEEAADLASRATRLTDPVGIIATCVDLADAYGESPPIAEALGRTWAEAAAGLEVTEAGRGFLTEFRERLRLSGSRSVAGGEPWSEAEESAWKLLSIEAEERTGQRSVSGDRVELPGGRALQREVRLAVDALMWREQAKAAVLALGGFLWRADREIGFRLASAGRLELATDVDLVDAREIEALLEGSGPALAEIAGRRRRLDGQILDSPLPRLFHGTPVAARRPPIAGERLQGWAASPGRFEGRARVVDSPQDGMKSGEVLVARTTDASWAPLFLTAGAVVVEEGGPLSHAAILSRELGVPAVLNLPGIIDRVEREVGEVVTTVDGTTGEVVLHRAGPPPDRNGPADGTGGGTDDGSPEPVLGAGVAPPDEPPDDAAVLHQFGIFVTGLIGAGTLLSVMFRLAQAVSGVRTRARLEMRARRLVPLVVEAVLSGSAHALVSPLGVRSRRFYGASGGLLSFLGAGLAVVAVGGEARSDWDPLWRALGLAGAAEVLALAALLSVSAWRWPLVPLPTRRLIPAGAGAWDRWRRVVGRRGTMVVALCLGFVATVALLITFAEDHLQEVDEWLYDAMGAGSDIDRWGPEWLELVGTSSVVLPVAGFVALSVLRCRVLAWSIPALIAAAGMTHLALGHFVPRDRPPLSTRAGDIESFPGGFVLEATLVLGVLPLAVAVLTRWTSAVRLARIIAAAAFVLAVPDSVRLGTHWPSDNLSGFALGVAFVVVAHRVARAPELHEGCRRCPNSLAATGDPASGFSMGNKGPSQRRGAGQRS